MDQIYHRIYNRMFNILRIEEYDLFLDLRTINDCLDHQGDENHH
jgi:hypothetical protein